MSSKDIARVADEKYIYLTTKGRKTGNPHTIELWFAIADERIYLSPIFKWFASDFIKKYGPKKNFGRHNKKESAVLNFIASYLGKAQKDHVLTGKFKIKYLKYDWSLNEQRAKK